MVVKKNTKSEISDIKVYLGGKHYYRKESTSISSVSAHLSLSFPLSTFSDFCVSVSQNSVGIYIVHTL